MPNSRPATATLPWIKLYASEWRRVTVGLSALERGAFLDLCLAAWQEHGELGAPECSLADDDAVLARTAGLTPAEWRRHGQALRRLFPPHPDAPGHLRSPWLAGLYAAQLRAYTSHLEKGRKGGRPRKDDTNAAHPQPNLSETPGSLEQNLGFGKSEGRRKKERRSASYDAEQSGALARDIAARRGDAPLAGAGGPGASPREERSANGTDPGTPRGGPPVSLTAVLAELASDIVPRPATDEPPPEALAELEQVRERYRAWQERTAAGDTAGAPVTVPPDAVCYAALAAARQAEAGDA